MNIYGESAEQDIAAERSVREWNRSALLEDGQLAAILPIQSGLRRTNVFLRLILFVFGALIIAASFLLIMEVCDLDSRFERALLCGGSAVVCFFLAESLASKFHLYRFGVEEAAAVAVIVNAGLAATAFSDAVTSSLQTELPEFIGLITAAVAAWGIFLRFGYVYAALGSIFCLSMAPSQLHNFPDFAQRLIPALILAVVCVLTRSKRREHRDDICGDRYAIIHAIAFLGMYAALNLAPNIPSAGNPEFPRSVVWFTYLMIWILPVVGLCVAIRHKDRPLLDASLITALATLVSNKSYLGMTRETWDPILLGVLLVGTAVAVRWWLSRGPAGMRQGFTASRILSSDLRSLSIVGTVSAITPVIPGGHSEVPSTPKFEPGGGRSGGGGASGSF
jgi:hypothetical protein